MRLSAAFQEEAYRYRVYDYLAGQLRRDLVWVDDVTNQVGVGFATWGREHTFEIEQRKRILIIPGMYWIALDLPEEETKQSYGKDLRIPVEVTYGVDYKLSWNRKKNGGNIPDDLVVVR